MLNLKIRINSLFAKILLSFLTVILLLALFNLLSFTFFENNIQKEIIQYNRLILKNTTERYDNYFQTVKGLMFKFYYDEKVTQFNRQLSLNYTGDVNYLIVNDITKDIRTSVYNPFLFLDNIIIYFNNPSLIIEKGGTSEPERMFSQFYVSAEYPLSFWKKQYERSNNNAIFPSALFSIVSSDSQQKQLIPFDVKVPSSNYEVIALLDAKMLFQTFHGGTYQKFMILNEEGTVLYKSSSELTADKLPEWNQDQGYVVKNNLYYFFEKGSDTKLTYVTMVPYSSMASQIKELKYTLWALFILSIVIAVITSVFFSKRINQPVKQIIASMLQRNPTLLQSKIQEFDYINEKIQELIVERNDIRSDLLNKTSLLTNYGYISKLKMINSDINEWQDFVVMDRNFTIVLYQLHFRTVQSPDITIQPERAAYYIREYIDLTISEKFNAASHTFQVENNQILSIVFGNEIGEEMKQTLHVLKQIFDRDMQYCLITITVSSEFSHSSEFNLAYKQVLEMLKQAKLSEETQLIFEYMPEEPHFAFTAEQEQEFYINMQAGNDSICIQLVFRMLTHMCKKEARAHQFRQFAEGIMAKTYRILEILKLAQGHPHELTPLSEELKETYTLDHYRAFFTKFISAAASLIRTKKEHPDRIADFVIEFLENHYSEDIFLDAVADKLNMSSAYLSAYIKEKTGTNFSEHLNNVRIRKAKELLANTDSTISDIGLQIGYRNVTSFIRMFKKLTGSTPGEFRQTNYLKLDS